ncbi:rab-like protein 2A [Theristicus caerulescens]
MRGLTQPGHCGAPRPALSGLQSIHASYCHKAPPCIMVLDVQPQVTYKSLNSWYKELGEFCPEIPCTVVASKIDVDMKGTQKSFSFAWKFSLPFYFVSAADGTNVVKLFNDAIKLAVAYKQNSGDFMDEVTQELEERKALLAALLLSD